MKILRWLDKWLEECIVTVFIGYFVIACVIQVITRYVLHLSAPWAEESARYAFIWFTFIGASLAVKRNSHVRVDILDSILHKRNIDTSAVIWAADIILLCFFILSFICSIPVIQFAIDRKQFSAAMQLPMQYVYVSFPLGMILSAFRMIQRMVKKLREGKAKR